MSEPDRTFHVKGASAYTRPASLTLETFSVLADLGLSTLLFFVGMRVFKLSSVPRLSWIPMLLALAAALWIAQKLLFATTFGEQIWRLRAEPSEKSRLRWRLIQHSRPDAGFMAGGTILTVLAWGLAVIAAHPLYAYNPLWLRAEKWNISPFLPDLSTRSTATPLGEDKWAVAPFFYTLGTWPVVYDGHPVFYSLPYEKGPPSRFIGHIHARWKIGETQVTFEGPKTPNPPIIRSALRDCLLTGASERHSVLECWSVREQVMQRHLHEMRGFDPSSWRLRWFIVENPAIPSDEQAQGVFLSASDELRIQERFILVTAKGTQQAIILDTVTGAEGERARERVEHAIGSLRISDELGPGRAWVDKQLENIRLDELKKTSDFPMLLESLAEIQAQLLGKISVDPKTFDAYYHLAGTAMLLLRNAAERHQNELAVTAKPLIQSLYRYGQDVSAQDKKTETKMTQLQNLWVDAQKYR